MVHFTSTDSSAGASLPADTSLSSGQGTYSATLTAAGAQTITARDTVTASITGGLNVSVRAASANHLVLNTATSTPTAGAAFSFTVTAQDPYGNTDPAYAGTVHFTSTDTAAGVLLPADTTLSSGQGTYSATLIRAGGQTITARDTVTASISGPLSVSVRAAPANHLTLTSATSTPTAGAAFSLTVTAQDQYGNTDLAYGGPVHFSSTDTAAGVLLPAATTPSTGHGT